MVRGDRSVDVFVRKLRNKLERISPDWRYVHTHFGVGYRFTPERATPERATPGRAEAEGVEPAAATSAELPAKPAVPLGLTAFR
jgi:DNA-binding winged helix-turn-helix (wHTH) protein